MHGGTDQVIKYACQDRPSNCGPMAIFNLFLWGGFKPREIDIYKIESTLHCDMKWGTHKYRITDLLKAIKYKFVSKRKVKVKDIEKALNRGMGVIYLYMFDKHVGHYVFIYGQTKKRFLVANDISKRDGNVPVMKRSKKYYGKCSQRHSKHHRERFFGIYPHAWFIEK